MIVLSWPIAVKEALPCKQLYDSLWKFYSYQPLPLSGFSIISPMVASTKNLLNFLQTLFWYGRLFTGVNKQFKLPFQVKEAYLESSCTIVVRKFVNASPCLCGIPFCKKARTCWNVNFLSFNICWKRLFCPIAFDWNFGPTTFVLMKFVLTTLPLTTLLSCSLDHICPNTCSNHSCYIYQGILKGEVSLYVWPPVWLVWNQLCDNWQFLFLFAKQTNPNQSNRRSMVQ